MLRILLLSDIHAGESRESTTHPGIIRQANSQALKTLECLIPKFNQQAFDVIVNLGDLIRDINDPKKDSQLLEKALQVFKLLQPTPITILGNHDLKSLTYSQATTIFNRHALSSQFDGDLHIKEYHLIWLSPQFNHQGVAVISPKQKAWLAQTLTSPHPKLIFTHYSLVPQYPQGNFYFSEKNLKDAAYQESEALSLISHTQPVALISGHLHWAGLKYTQQIPALTAPSFSENIASVNPHRHPGIYSVLTHSRHTLSFQSFSYDYCFFNLELPVKS